MTSDQHGATGFHVHPSNVTRTMTTYNGADIRERVLLILEEFDEFSKKNGIEYYAIGGTLLGAIRHGGFIPWDDDIDIGVPREDYDRMIAIAGKFSAPYRLESFELNHEFVYPFAKLYDTSTTVTEDFVKPFRRGLWIDIFPLDGSFENERLRRAHYKVIEYIRRKITMNNESLVRDESRSGKTISTKLVEAFWKSVPISALHGTLQCLLKMKKFRKSTYAGNLLGRWGGDREIMATGIISPPAIASFSGMELPIPNNPGAYLTNVYGDYMVLPPEEKRVSGHKFLEIDLDHSYLDPIRK